MFEVIKRFKIWLNEEELTIVNRLILVAPN